MEDDGAVKAPVTRLRRRLSVEQSDDAKSPAPATPTKKRGGRLAAKPQLELIDENASDTSSSKKSTKRAAVKDLVDTTEEKQVTPSRRSTRIKSNTSIVSETSQAVDSPRAKRAARRTSQVGSDTETLVTSARKPRKTRKDSTTSIDKLDITTTTAPDNLADESNKNVKNEENEEPQSSSQTSEDATKEIINTENTSLRKSPRLSGKKHKYISDRKSIESTNNDDNDATMNNTFNDLNIQKAQETSPKHESSKETDQKDTAFSTSKSKHNLSEQSINLLQNLNKKAINAYLNKSTPALDSSNNVKNSRQRTHSLTVLAQSKIGDGLFHSDNESTKKKIKIKRNSLELQKEIVHPGSGDNEVTNSKHFNDLDSSHVNKDLNSSRNKNLRRGIINSHKSLTDNMISPNKSNIIATTASPASLSISPQGNKENIGIDITTPKEENSNTKSLFDKPPSAKLQSTVYFEDSDSDSKGKETNTPLDIDDQCVPVVDSRLDTENKSYTEKKNIPETNSISINASFLDKSTGKVCNNNSCEPMDIDETIPNNESLILDNSDNKSLDAKEQKSISSFHQVSMNKSSNKSKRKSSLSSSQNLEKTENENKSTLILSQIKDTSSTDKSVSESPKPSNEILSKSVNSLEVSNAKATDKKKLSVDYSTSTPLQQKKIQKLGMQINSSIIDTSNTETKTDSTKNLNKLKKEISSASNALRTSATSEDESESDNEESSNEKNELIDDEAEDASDDYESGDSRDEEDKLYEKENEIIEKGETLDSEEDFSGDSDYEKDSFVVSSDEEDDDLLSGSGDDLSNSDNELTMSKKSKHKFNERKLKEQKKASKEMFEARHKLETSKKQSKTPKIESSDDSDGEVIVRTRKNKNQRLDSTHEQSLDKTVNKSVSKINQISESSSEETSVNEREISSLFKGNTTKSDDPLSVLVKQEPKTPITELNISTVHINQNIEEVEVDNNVSIARPNQTSDPLQATLANDSEDSTLSENSDIAKNYDLVLNDLNNDSQKSKLHDISLNLNKKTKQNYKEPIGEQLNLTNVKDKSKNKRADTDVVDAATNKTHKKQPEIFSNKDNESSSESIDLKLLFSDDSNNCADVQESNKKKETQEVVEDFIPLKRTPGKINMLSSEGKKNTPNNKSVTESVTSKKQKSGEIEETSEDEQDDNDIKIIIDTQGSRSDRVNTLDMSLNSSSKKKKNKKVSISNQTDLQKDDTEETNNDNDDGAPLEVSFKSSKNYKKNKDISKNNAVDELSLNVSGIAALESSICTTESGKKKKNKKHSESQTGKDILESSVSLPESGKKKKKLSESLTVVDILESSVCLPESGKKKKKRSESQTDIESHELSASIPESGKKKKKNLSESQTGVDILESSVCLPESGKKKKKRLESQTDIEVYELSTIIPESGKKKKKRLSESQTDADNKADSLNVSVAKHNSSKKNKSLLESQVLEEKDPDTSYKVNMNLSIGSAKKQKIIVDEENVSYTNTDETDEVKKSKKRKRKSSANIVIDNEESELGKNEVPIMTETLNSTLGSQKKKRKISQNDTPKIPDINDNSKKSSASISKKDVIDIENDEAHHDLQTVGVQKKKNKKRKERDDDEGNKVAKVFKENSFDKVHVTRLPASILNQLEDKPNKEVLNMKKSTVVSTSSFIVEETRKRKNKPSNYLEESVYLNETHVEKKQKVNLKKPKVLPFVPTAVTSDSGFTTNFKINVIPQEVQFVAQTKNAANFKNDYLYSKKIKRMGTYEMYKKHRNVKICKF